MAARYNFFGGSALTEARHLFILAGFLFAAPRVIRVGDPGNLFREKLAMSTVNEERELA